MIWKMCCTEIVKELSLFGLLRNGLKYYLVIISSHLGSKKISELHWLEIEISKWM